MLSGVGGEGGHCCMGWWGGVGAPNNNMLLEELNTDPSLNAKNLLNDFLSDDENISQFFISKLNSEYLDLEAFKNKFAGVSHPIFLSVNIQSLNSKFPELKQLILDLQNCNVQIDVILLQETWHITYPEFFSIPNFQKIIFRNIKNMRGGG